MAVRSVGSFTLVERPKGEFPGNRELFRQAEQFSRELSEQLGLSESDLEFFKLFTFFNTTYPSLEDRAANGFLKVEVGGKEFSLFASTIHSKSHDGGDWVQMVQVACMSDPSLNTSAGVGTSLINAIPVEWQRRLLVQLTGEVKAGVRQKIDQSSSRLKEIGVCGIQYSDELFSRLGLSANGREGVLNRFRSSPERPFMEFEVEGKQFALFVQNTWCSYYTDQRSDWRPTIQVVCINDPSLNTVVSRGTSKISIIPAEWHRKLLDRIDDGVRLRLQEQLIRRKCLKSTS